MNYFYFFLWMLVDNLINASALSCLMHDKCLEDLRHFSHADDFYVYQTLEEAEDACSKAKDAYLCVMANPDCRHPTEMAKLSPILRGSFRLLNEFCGFRSKRRPCCALRTAYLEHSDCYGEVSEGLTDCNDKYRISLEKILTIEDKHEQNKQRFCSVKWLGNCVKAATNSYCGKVAAQIIRTYFTEAGKPEKSFLEENTECDGPLYGAEEEEMKCNLKFCGAKLLNFDHFSFTDLYRKMEYATFCVKNCTPAVVHEFFRSIIYGITKRIPGHCSGDECVDKNRFVALAKCVENEAWSILQCTKTLIDLAHIGLVANPAEEKRNTTCDIMTNTVQCIEETLQKCGDKPFRLVKEILGDFIRIGISAYCHPEYRKQGLFMKRTTGPYNNFTEPAVTEGPDYKHPQFVKGYRQGGGALGFPSLSYFCLLLSIFSSVIFSVHLIR